MSQRGVERLDLLLPTIEALDPNGKRWFGQASRWPADAILQQVELWKRRCRNPLRRTTCRDQLNL